MSSHSQGSWHHVSLAPCLNYNIYGQYVRYMKLSYSDYHFFMTIFGVTWYYVKCNVINIYNICIRSQAQ
jgi:hypothetical protein